MEQKELDWNYYKMHVDLHRSYLDLVVKINLFYYAITGGIVSYYFANASQEYIKHSLLLPICMSLLLALVFIYGGILANNMRNEIRNAAIKCGFEFFVEGRVLVVFVAIFVFLFICVFLSLSYVYLCN